MGEGWHVGFCVFGPVFWYRTEREREREREEEMETEGERDGVISNHTYVI